MQDRPADRAASSAVQGRSRRVPPATCRAGKTAWCARACRSLGDGAARHQGSGCRRPIEELESTTRSEVLNEEYSRSTRMQSANESWKPHARSCMVNEELTTVNGELAHRVQELTRATSDLKISSKHADSDGSSTTSSCDKFHASITSSASGRNRRRSPIGPTLRRAYRSRNCTRVERRVLRTLRQRRARADRPTGIPATSSASCRTAASTIYRRRGHHLHRRHRPHPRRGTPAALLADAAPGADTLGVVRSIDGAVRAAGTPIVPSIAWR